MSDSPDVIRTTLLGLSVNMSLGLLKYITGQRLSCKPLAADGMHSVGDSFIDMGAFIVVSSVSSKLLEKFQVSHATFEQIGTLVIGMLVLVGGLSVGRAAIRSLLTTTKRPLGCSGESSFSHMYAVGIALASILSKELLYIYSINVSQRTNSTIIAANAAHHRLDSLTTALALVSIVSTKLAPSWRLDDCCGLLIAGMVIGEGAGIVSRISLDLLNNLGGSAGRD